ncbi:MAG: BACON domain-containing protein [Bacteroidales bacterium]|nr:BACON domain-containing protein [Bacteroidales bacterium]
MKKSILFLAAFAALVSCVKENPVEENPAVDTPAVEYQTITFEATAPSALSDDATKTTLVDGGLVHWSNGDQVKVGFFPTTGKDNTIVSSVGTFTATFDQETSASSYFTTDSWNWSSKDDQYRGDGLAVYPSSATIYSKRSGNWSDANTEVSYDLPAEQIAVLNSFQSGVNFSYAKVNKADFIENKASLSFINACALLKITLPSTAADVKSIVVSSKNGVALSGKFEIPFGKEGYYHDDPWATNYANSDGTLSFQAVAGNPSVSIVAPDEKTLQSGGTYYVVVWPGTHSSGLDFEFTNSEGLTCEKSLSESVSFTRAKIAEFNFTSELVFVESPTLELGSETLEMSPTGETKSFTFSVNNDWTVSEDAAWLELDKVSGSASENVSVNATAVANTTSSVRTATITITNTAGLAKTMTVSQNPVTYKVSGSYLAYASELTNGLYVIANKYSSNLFWTESGGKLSMSSHSTADKFYCANVFEYTQDDSKVTIVGNRVDFDDYRSWSAGKWRSLSTGKYLDEDFGLEAESDEAVYLVSVNNWGGSGGGELQGYDVYHSKTTTSEKSTLWYHNDAFTFGDMNYGYSHTDNTSVGKRKYFVYKVVQQ